MKKSSNVALIVLAVVLPILILIIMVAATLVVITMNNVTDVIKENDLIEFYSEKDLIGRWYDSSGKMNIVLNSDKTVEFYSDDKTSIYVKGTYTVEQDLTNEIGDEYIITITTYDRVVDNKKYTDKYTTKFSIVTEDYKQAVMMNVVTYNMYYLTKVDNSSSTYYSNNYTNTINNNVNTNTVYNNNTAYDTNTMYNSNTTYNTNSVYNNITTYNTNTIKR